MARPRFPGWPPNLLSTSKCPSQPCNRLNVTLCPFRPSDIFTFLIPTTPSALSSIGRRNGPTPIMFTSSKPAASKNGAHCFFGIICVTTATWLVITNRSNDSCLTNLNQPMTNLARRTHARRRISSRESLQWHCETVTGENISDRAHVSLLNEQHLVPVRIADERAF